MSYSPRKPASSNATPQKLFLFPGDPLIKTLKPESYVIVSPSSFDTGSVSGDNPGDGGDGPGDPPTPNPFEPPNLEDITLISKKLVTDKNKNQYIEFIFNVKNHVGDEVVGVQAYGQ